jgi:DnaJ family protein A protein 5
VQGFYQVYDELFQLLNEEERDEAEDQEEYEDAPPFGNSKTPIKEVAKFYDHWSNFVSVRSFAFADKYRLSDAPNRKVKRLMEQDNKKERQKARKVRIDDVRVCLHHFRITFLLGIG